MSEQRVEMITYGPNVDLSEYKLEWGKKDTFFPLWPVYEQEEIIRIPPKRYRPDLSIAAKRIVP